MVGRLAGTTSAGPWLAEPSTGYSDRRVAVMVGLLILSFVLNIANLSIVAIVGQEAKQELGISDTGFGLLTGVAFAVAYSVMGLPLARLADRGDRVRLISIAVAVWSVLTVACGMAGSFWQLLLARIGVAAAEPGSIPASHSLMATYVRPERRGLVFALFAGGGVIGQLLALVVGGLVTELYGWRAGFIVMGVAGLPLALAIGLYLREPRRAARDAAQEPPIQFVAGARLLSRSRALQLLVAATVLCYAAQIAVANWLPSFFMRTYDLSPGRAGVTIGVIFGLSNLVGAGITSYLSMRAARRGPGAVLVWPALLVGLAGVAHALVLFAPSAGWALLLGTVPTLLNACWYGPIFASIPDVVRPDLRATAAALVLFMGNLVGIGFGPTAVGVLSDLLRPELGDDSLRWALFAVMQLMAPAGLCMWLASRAVAREADQAGEAGPAMDPPLPALREPAG